jgi:ATP-binding cassette, subfamily B, bacterial PglK
MKYFFKQFFFLLDHEAKRRLPFLVVMFLVSSFLDVIGISLIGFFLVLITNPEHFMAFLPFGQGILNHFSLKSFIYVVAAVIVAAFLLKAWLGCLIQKKVALFGSQYAFRLKLKLMRAYQAAPYSFHLRRSSSDVLNCFGQTDAYINSLLTPVLTLCLNALIVVFILSLLVILHPAATLGLSVLFAAIIWLNGHLIKKKARSLGLVLAVAGAESMKSIQHALQGLKEIRIMGTEPYFLRKLELVADRISTASSQNTFYQAIPRYAIEALLAVFIIILCVVNLASGASASSTVAFIGVFVAAGVRLLPTVTQLAGGLNQIRFSIPKMNLLSEELRELEGLQGKDELQASSEKAVFSKVEFRDIHYAYEEVANIRALQALDLTICKGESVGIIGMSGAGKSTLVNVLLGLLTPQQGEILVDGKPIANMRTWLNNFAYIPQSIFLLDDSVKRNIGLGVEDADMDDARLEQAIQMAQLDQVIKDLPQGVDTLIGESGVRLSGGQRQRIALARAFYHERDIIVMDEATSALDNETEKEVIKAIKQLHGKKTLVVIAHRLTTVEHCDVIIKLKQGRVEQMGSFQEVVGETVSV